MAAAVRIDPSQDPLAAVLAILDELEAICDKEAGGLAKNLVKIKSKVNLMDGHAKDLQQKMPGSRDAIKSKMRSLKDKVAGFIDLEREMPRDADFYMKHRPRAAEDLRNSIAETSSYFSAITR